MSGPSDWDGKERRIGDNRSGRFPSFGVLYVVCRECLEPWPKGHPTLCHCGGRISGHAGSRRKQDRRQQITDPDLLAALDASQRRIRELEAALSDLLDEQQDAPLERRRAQWETSVQRGRALITKEPE